MGLFGPSKEFRERDFTMPCTRREALNVILSASDWEGTQRFGDPFQAYVDARDGGDNVDLPPLVECVYIRDVSEDGFVIGAGNRVRTYWKYRLALVGDNPTRGSLTPIEINIEHWPGSVFRMNSCLSNAVRSVGGKTGRWPGSF